MILSERWKGLLYLHASELANRFRATMKDDAKETMFRILYNLAATEVIVLDDYGAANIGPWAVDHFDTLLNRRYDMLSKTLITTNLTLDGFGRVSGRIHSRVQDKMVCHWVDMRGVPDYRVESTSNEPREAR